jgi:competence protein ComEC
MSTIKKFMLILSLIIVIAFSSLGLAASSLLSVNFIDVGQADSILVHTPSGYNMLVDAGNNDDGDTVTSFLSSQGIKRLDVLIGTHPHEDHIGGMDTVIRQYQIGRIYMPKVTSTTKTFEDVLQAIKNKGLNVNSPVPGSTIPLDSAIKVQILAPNSSKYEDLNNYSIVIRISYDKTSFLLTGDAENESEKEMLEKGYDLKADVLKVGHHGSSNSTSASFLKAVAPKYAVICVGKDNVYGHPKQEILDRLNQAGAKVFRTDLNGTVIAESDGEKVTVKGSKRERLVIISLPGRNCYGRRQLAER